MTKKRNPYPKYITYISAPNIPTKEVAVLRKQYERKGTLVTNYETHVATVVLNRGDRLVVVAPDIPAKEVKELRRHIKRAERDPDYAIVTNYEVNVWAVPKAQRAG
jgi:hypothetical protein